MIRSRSSFTNVYMTKLSWYILPEIYIIQTSKPQPSVCKGGFHLKETKKQNSNSVYNNHKHVSPVFVSTQVLPVRGQLINYKTILFYNFYFDSDSLGSVFASSNVTRNSND